MTTEGKSRSGLCLNSLRAQASVHHQFETKKMVLTNHDLTYAGVAQRLIAKIDAKPEMQKGEAKRWKDETADFALEDLGKGKVHHPIY